MVQSRLGNWRAAFTFALSATIFCRSIPDLGRQAARWGRIRRMRCQFAPPIDPAHPDLPHDQEPKQQQLGRLGIRQRALRLDAAPEFAMEPLDGIGGPQALPMTRGEPAEGQQFLARFLQALDDLRGSGAPRAHKRAVRLLRGAEGRAA